MGAEVGTKTIAKWKGNAHGLRRCDTMCSYHRSIAQEVWTDLFVLRVGKELSMGTSPQLCDKLELRRQIVAVAWEGVS